MATGKVNLESNFDRLKKQMLQKRDKAEQQPTDENKNINEASNSNKNTNKNIDNDIITNGINDDYDAVNNDVNKDTNVNINSCTNKNVNNYVYKHDDANSNKFVIRVERKDETLKRQTYYLKESTIKIIDEISESSKVGKSELVQKILEEALKNIKIERT